MIISEFKISTHESDSNSLANFAHNLLLAQNTNIFSASTADENVKGILKVLFVV